MSFDKWKDYKLDDLVHKRNQGVNTTTEKVKYSDKGIPVIRAQNILSSGLDFTDLTYVNEETFGRIRIECKPQLNDILFTNIGSQFGTACKVKTSQPFLIAWNVLRLQPNFKVNPDFLVFLLNNQVTRTFIRSLNSSSTMPFVSGSVIGNIKLSIPPLSIQNRIAAILSSLDDKIELNRQTNKTLESIAQALFNEWFVNFNFPGATGDMQGSELNKIPTGWRVGKMDDVLTVKGGTTPSTKVAEYWDGDFHWATPKDLSNLQFPILLSTERKLTQAGVKQISSGILPEGTLLMSSRAPIGYLAITNIPVSINQGFIAINGTELSNLFLLLWLKQNLEKVISRSNGSTFLEISKSSFKEIEILIPDHGILKRFDAIAYLIFEQIKSNEQQIQTLIQLRDTLLPKLMKGEISVTETFSKAHV